MTELFEPFVDAAKVAEYLCLSTYAVLAMARRGELPAHPIKRKGGVRATWRFRMSEVHAFFSAGKNVASARVDGGSPSVSGKRAS